MYPRPIAAACVLAAALFLTACGSDTADKSSTPTPAAEASSSASTPAQSTPSGDPAGDSVEITVKGDDITPNAEKVKVKVGEKIILSITSDREGELHLHTTPDRHIAFSKGTTKAEVSIDRPGLVELEEHESSKLLAQFEAR